MLVENGPFGKGRAMRAVDATDDGTQIWFVGDAKLVGYYDLASGERNDYTSVDTAGDNPSTDALSGSVTAVTAAGDRGREKLLFADSSGNILSAYMNENDDPEDLRIDWEFLSSPTNDTSIEAIESDTEGIGFAVDNGAAVDKPTASEGWSRWASSTPTGVCTPRRSTTRRS